MRGGLIPGLVTVALVLTACTSSSTHGTAATSAKHACELITPDVIGAAHFPRHVVKRTKSNGVGKHGASGCTYGDDPDPTTLSADFLALLIMTPASLRAQHTTAKREARAVASPCPASAVRELAPAPGLGSYAYFCVKPGHAPAGAWVSGDDVYLLEVGSPTVNFGTTVQRETEFRSVADAIARDAGR